MQIESTVICNKNQPTWSKFKTKGASAVDGVKQQKL